MWCLCDISPINFRMWRGKLSIPVTLILIVVACFSSSGVAQRSRHNNGNRQALRNVGYNQRSESLLPNVFNVAAHSIIEANATCGTSRFGTSGSEEFCRLAADLGLRAGGRRSGGGIAACGICSANSPDAAKRHPIQNAIDGTQKWWQSPTLHQGPQFETVTITLDLRQVYQIVYVIVKAANSPRPGSWVLERSLDGENFTPWQYYAVNDQECWDLYGIPPTPGKPHYKSDTDVICTSYYSKLVPLENGEIHTNLIHGRPGSNISSPGLLDFTLARYVRLRLLRHHAASLQESTVRSSSRVFLAGTYSEKRVGTTDAHRAKRLYYSIRDINIGGQCVCNGHATRCSMNNVTWLSECECEHNTCGRQCEKCCPLYNQIPYEVGKSISIIDDGIQQLQLPFFCEACECYGHASSCQYDEIAAQEKLSIDTHGRYRGGGVCINCSSHTMGTNCEQCKPGYYRPEGRDVRHQTPCEPCDCHPAGSNGDCIREPILDDETAGDCICRPGFIGPRCSVCAPGYRAFPKCEPCLCDKRGVIKSDECENDCSCKVNVEGPTCNQCKPGYFALQVQNPDGCISCYCSGVSQSCEATVPLAQVFETLENWLVTDIAVSLTVKPSVDTDTGWLLIGNYEIPGIEAYYWLAPPLYIGNKLEAYGSYLSFRLNWVVMRGDTSGKPTTGPNLILIGQNGLRIAYGEFTFTGINATINVPLTEHNWYHVPTTVKDIVTRLRRTEYQGDPVTRSHFLSILANIKYVLLRAKYHTDQIEGALERTVLEIKPSFDAEKNPLSLVEKCSCPPGYVGLSCETCDYGYIRIEMNTSTHLRQGKCLKCDCNGHSRGCDFDTGECECEHNTIGEKCERCAPGYYGNPLFGSVDDCKRCACPLIDPENNFSPSCQLDVLDIDTATSEDVDYVCTQCPQGYTGDHCEICDHGYFGDPMTLGSSCRPCECNGGPCDHFTGKCSSCRGNTEGWKCERCKPLHWGDPKASTGCRPCNCDTLGAVHEQCDINTGHCQCRTHYTGVTCNVCEIGYGNVTAGCPQCVCDNIGAESSICDPVTGICDCKLGVEGFRCDACQHLHYGFSSEGCEGCRCSQYGSQIHTCDIVTGQCKCKPNFFGRTCDTCISGHWLLENTSCIPCNCDPVGSLDENCDIKLGQCYCKRGVTGKQCNTCLPNYYGFSETGCKECDHCDKPGHLCDPDTGRCICPPFSHGEVCSRCIPNSWGFEPSKGCKPCKCDEPGSLRTQCNPLTGACSCRTGYTGSKCQKCEVGYWGYPYCRRCNCNMLGTILDQCDPNTRMCSCNNDNGQCLCKSNVIGRACDQCRQGTFSLAENNLEGCTPCFCFGRSAHCSDSGLTWGTISLKWSRMLELRKEKDSFRNISYIQQTIPAHLSKYSFNQSPTTVVNLHPELTNIDGKYIIPESHGNITIGIHRFLYRPLYWSLPREFLGDRILSYGGYLNFTTTTENVTKIFSQKILNKYPKVIIKGNNITLGSLTILESLGSIQEVRFHESLWSVLNAPDIKLKTKSVTRELMMVVLQNIQNIFLRATNAEYFSKAVLHEVFLETAIHIKGQRLPFAKGIELCECPKMYNSSSCQNPSIGFFRQHNKVSPNGTIIIDLIGEVKPCECNGRSTICNTETGYCLNCTNNTAGHKCEICAEGYYGNPNISECIPCLCPSNSQNFAHTCEISSNGDLTCKCKKGYTGKYCDSCSFGYYSQKGTFCERCLCNINGSTSEECDEHTGQCNCKPGHTGRDCSLCEKPRHMLQNNHCVPCDNCTQWLLNELEILKEYELDNNQHLDVINIPPPYELLDIIENKTLNLKTSVEKQIELKKYIRDISDKPYINLEKDIKKLDHKIKKLSKKSIKSHKDSQSISSKSNGIYKDINNINKTIYDTTAELKLFGHGDKHLNVMSAAKEAQKILEEIRNINISDMIEDILQKIDKYSVLLAGITEFNEDIEDFYKRINDMDAIIQLTFVDINRVNSLLTKNRNNLNNLNYLNSHISSLINSTEMDTFKKYLSNGANANVNSEKYINDIKNKKQALENIIKYYQRKENITNDLKNKVQKAKEHAKNLHDQANVFKELFKETKNGSDYALKAVQAYQNVVESINKANTAAHEAHNIFTNNFVIFLNNTSLRDEILLILLNSENIQKQAQNQLNKTKDFREVQMKNINDSFVSLKEQFVNTASHDNNISLELENSKSKSVFDKMRIVLKNAGEESISMNKTYSKAKQIQRDISYKLNPALKDLNASEANKPVTLSSAEENLTVAQTQQRKLNEALISYESVIQNQSNTMNELINSIGNESQTLKEKIDEARRIANTINLPLTNNDQDCVRVFKTSSSTSGLKTSTTISFILSIKSDVQNSSIIYLGGTSQQFIAIEMVNKKIRLLWNLGDDIETVTHPEEINTLTVNSGYYYIVEAKIIFNVGELVIKKMYSINGAIVDENSTKILPINNTSNSNHILFDFGSSNELWVGGIPPDSSHDSLLRQHGLKVSIYRLVLDEHPIGLWNYINKTGNCKSDNFWTDTSEAEYQFNGDGYSVKTLKGGNKKRSVISINFKTFDENALILAVLSAQNDSYISIYLENGKLACFVQYTNSLSAAITTTKKYNTGEKVYVELRRVFIKSEDKLQINVNNEILNRSTFGNDVMLPNLHKARYYIGGLPPTFKKIYKNFTVHNLSKQKSFMGCMWGILIGTETIDPVNTEHYGITYSCSDKLYNKVGFLGNGYIAVNKSSTGKLISFSFVFVTDEANSHLATIILNSENSHKELIEFSINNGKIHIKVADNEFSTLSSETTYNDSMFHVISIHNSNASIFRIDNIIIEKPLQPIHGNLSEIYFGKNCISCIHTLKPFNGTIKDVILNNKFVYFNSDISFANVTIGRDGPKNVILSTINSLHSKVTSKKNSREINCNKIKNYSIEPGAMKFGDKGNSFVKHNFPGPLWQSNFILELEFRTFEPNGMLYISPGYKQKKHHYICVHIKNGTVCLTVQLKYKHIHNTILKVNDGKWHKLIFKNEDRKWSLIVDKEISKYSKKGPKKLNLANIIHIGGVAPNEKRLSNDIMTELVPFKGCIKNLKVNTVNQDLAKSDNENVRQCFTNIELGSYFSGDAFALYTGSFSKASEINLTLDFKSSDINGVIMVSDQFSIELFNGKVIVSLKMNNNSKTLSAVHSPVTKFSLCDNHWHKIKAQLSKNLIIIEVDGKITTSTSRELSLRNDNYTNALYIGGLPDVYTQGILQTRENFKGCLKNIKVNGDNTNWAQMEKYNILLDSCPVV